MLLLFLSIYMSDQGHATTDDSSWQFVRGGFKEVLDLSAITSDNIWGVGAPGIFHFDGTDWKLVYENSDYPYIISIEMNSDGTGWAGTSSGFLNYKDYTWQPACNLNDTYITDIDLIDSYDGWAIAPTTIDGNVGAKLLRLQDECWMITPYTIIGNYDNIAVVDHNNVWLVGSTGIAHFDGISLLPVFSNPSIELRDISFSTSRSGWAVGGTCELGGRQRRTMLRYDGESWMTMIDQPGEAILQSVIALSPTSAIVGDHWGRVLLIKDDAVTIHESTVRNGGTRCLGGVEAMTLVKGDGDSVIMGGIGNLPFGGAYIMEFLDGKLIQRHGHRITSIDMAAEDRGWIVADGRILSYDGSRWTDTPIEPLLSDVFWNDITATTDGGFAAGGKGVIARYDGAMWRHYKLSDSDTIYRIMKTANSTLWALGRRYVEERFETFVLRHNEINDE